MKTVTRAVAVVIAAFAVATQAAVTIQMDALNILDRMGNLAPWNTLGLFVVDKTGNGIATGTMTAGMPISVGSYWGGSSDDLILGMDRISSIEEDGHIVINLISYTYPAGVTANMPFYLVWLPNQSMGNSTTLDVGWYGVFGDVDGTWSLAWRLPPDPTTLESYDMTTVSAGGRVPDSYGIPQYQIIPEPSSALLVGMGVLGFWMIRRRTKK